MELHRTPVDPSGFGNLCYQECLRPIVNVARAPETHVAQYVGEKFDFKVVEYVILLNTIATYNGLYLYIASHGISNYCQPMT